MKKVLALILFCHIAAQAQNITIKYVQEGTAIHAFATSSDTPPLTWDHFLSTDEAALLSSDPAVLDSKLTVQAKQQFTPVVTTPPPTPVQLRVASAIDPTTAATTASTFDAQKKQLTDGIAALNATVAKLSLLPIKTQLDLLTQIQNLVNSVVPK